MAQQKQKQQQEKDVLQRLADSGEEALQKFIGDLPGGSKVVGAANSLFARVDELRGEEWVREETAGRREVNRRAR